MSNQEEVATTSINLMMMPENNAAITMIHNDPELSIIKAGITLMKDGKDMGTASFPPIKPKFDDDDIEKKIRDSVVHAIYFSSKLYNICELSGEKYNGLELKYTNLRGFNGMVDIPRGGILYHPKYKDRMEDANLYFETRFQLLTTHSLSMFPNNKILNLKVKRSSGKIDSNARLFYGMPIRYLISKSSGDKILGISVDMDIDDKRIGSKIIPLSLIKRFNPELFPISITIYKDVPEWMQDERNEWETLMTSLLQKELDSQDYKIIYENKKIE